MGGGIKGRHYSDIPGIWDNVKKYQTIIKNLIQISDNSTIYVDMRIINIVHKSRTPFFAMTN